MEKWKKVNNHKVKIKESNKNMIETKIRKKSIKKAKRKLSYAENEIPRSSKKIQFPRLPQNDTMKILFHKTKSDTFPKKTKMTHHVENHYVIRSSKDNSNAVRSPNRPKMLQSCAPDIFGHPTEDIKCPRSSLDIQYPLNCTKFRGDLGPSGRSPGPIVIWTGLPTTLVLFPLEPTIRVWWIRLDGRLS